jgi:cytochrome b
MSKNQHVVPTDKGWGVRGEGNSRLTAEFDTQAEAIKASREICQNQRSEQFIHGRDGQIRERNSYGSDPFPPPG